MTSRCTSIPIGLALGYTLAACEVQNRDHCLHKSATPNAWCAEQEPGYEFCSPCADADERHGCVAEEPADCDMYEPGATSTGASNETTGASDDTADTQASSSSDSTSAAGATRDR